MEGMYDRLGIDASAIKYIDRFAGERCAYLLGGNITLFSKGVNSSAYWVCLKGVDVILAIAKRPRVSVVPKSYGAVG
jgi:hypothetical protein